MFQKNMYRWHRTISLVIALPVLLWAISGFMHPIMTTIKPKVATQFMPPTPIDSAQIKIPLPQVLQQHRIDSFSKMRFVHIGPYWFYQVQLPNQTEPLYFSTLNGKLLRNGNRVYAQYLAQYFLQGNKAMPTPPTNSTETDCCHAATSFVTNSTGGGNASITNSTLIQAFNSEYKSINKLLPVYKIDFARADGIRIYVEPTYDRFAFAMDNKRAVFDQIFQWFHSFTWLNFTGNFRLWVLGLLSALACVSTVLGIIIFIRTKSKSVKGNAKVKARRNHRYTAIVTALFTLFFAFSGSYHAFKKIDTNADTNSVYEASVFTATEANIPFQQLQALVKKPITNISLVHMHPHNYWQVQTAKAPSPAAAKNKPSKANKTVPPPSGMYINTNNLQPLTNGEVVYAEYLTRLFSDGDSAAIVNTQPITEFKGEYGFINKRLPVMKVQLNTPNHAAWYVETGTGQLATVVTNADRYEGLSFSFLHKHHFLDTAGKEWRDFSTMFWAMAQIAMVAIGLVLYFKTRKKTNSA